MSAYRALAPAKVNLGLFLGPRRTDGRHELVTVMQSISLADELTLRHAAPGADEDEVVCPGLSGPPQKNLAAAALSAFRTRTGWDAPPLRLTIAKWIPVAAGLGGGSADAAAALRLARHASGLGDDALLRELGFQLGADVPAQVEPGRWLATGAGERLQALAGRVAAKAPPPRGPAHSFGLLILPLDVGLSTGAVYAEADRLGLARSAQQMAERRSELLAAWNAAGAAQAVEPLAGELFHNDLQRAALSLCPQIADALAEATLAGADLSLVSGSGPTVVGVFFGAEGDQRAAEGAASLRPRVPGALCAAPVEGSFARAQVVEEPDRSAEGRVRPARESGQTGLSG